MIIARAPVRISLGGGGTDLASYYTKFGGFLIAGAINKYVFISVNKRFHKSIRLSYSKTEIVDHVDAVEHRLFRESLRQTGISEQLELVSVADVPANCGLGSSSTFTVALLCALGAYKREYLPLRQLAEGACHLEIDVLKEPIGKQDQYMAAFGGVTCLTFEKDGYVKVEPLRVATEDLIELESRILLFYTGIERSASEILAVQDRKSQDNDTGTLGRLHRIKEIGLETRAAFESGQLDRFGELLHEHWETKKRLSSRISDPFLDECYDTARQNGALGGKIMGAGGGGFFLFYCPGDKSALIRALTEKGLRHMPFHFDYEGAKTLVNMRQA